MKTHWIVDGVVDATSECEHAGWHLASAIEALQSRGLSREDAEAFAAFVFADRSEVRDTEPEGLVTDEQYRRIYVEVR